MNKKKAGIFMYKFWVILDGLLMALENLVFGDWFVSRKRESLTSMYICRNSLFLYSYLGLSESWQKPKVPKVSPTFLLRWCSRVPSQRLKAETFTGSTHMSGGGICASASEMGRWMHVSSICHKAALLLCKGRPSAPSPVWWLIDV